MSLVYNKGKYRLGTGATIWTSATIKAMLVASGYTADPDHPFVDSGAGAANPLTNENSGTGYVRKTLASKAVTQDDANNRIIYSAADLTWTTPNGFTANALILFQDLGGADSANPLLAYINGTGFPKVMNGTDFLVAWALTGCIING